MATKSKQQKTRSRPRRRSTGASRAPSAASPTADSRRISRALKQARQAAGLTQVEAARRIGIHPVSLYVWEQESQPGVPREKNLARAAQVYGTTVAVLRGEASASASATNGTTNGATNGATSSAGAPPVAKKRRGRPPKHASSSTGSNGTVPVSQAAGAASGGESTGTLPRSAYGRIFRALADLADTTNLGGEELMAVQRSLTNPALFASFGALGGGTLTEAELGDALDASAAAIAAFVSRRSNR